MPPWGAVKGFGDFRNDEALTPEQMELIVSWVSGGAPEGDAKDLPPAPTLAKALPTQTPRAGITVTGDMSCARTWFSMVSGRSPFPAALRFE